MNTYGAVAAPRACQNTPVLTSAFYADLHVPRRAVGECVAQPFSIARGRPREFERHKKVAVNRPLSGWLWDAGSRMLPSAPSRIVRGAAKDSYHASFER